MSLLQITDLEISFGAGKAVDGASFSLKPAETLGIVGESGCGKSLTCLSVLRLVPEPGKISGGRIEYQGSDLLRLNPRELRQIRGKEIAMIFQDPMTALNPVFTVGNQLCETIRVHEAALSRTQVRDRAMSLFSKVGIAEGEARMSQYPHELSGGLRQRVLIAMALSCQPKVLIADEPTTALDVTIQAQILELLLELKARENLALILVTHDLGVVSQVADRVSVMYAGKVVESGTVKQVLEEPYHPYTQGLLQSLPTGRKQKLKAIPGTVPRLGELPPGCRFQERCAYVVEECRGAEPELRKKDTHEYRCIRDAK